MLRLDFPLHFAWSELQIMQVGLLQMHRAQFFAEMTSGNYMRTFHVLRHLVLDYKSPNFIKQHFYDRERQHEQPQEE
jgi:hypothetical protein